MNIDTLLLMACEKGASDLHMVAGCSPVLRILGKLTPIEADPIESDAITAEDMSDILRCITTGEQKRIFDEQLELDFAYALPDGKRFRVNACRQKSSISLVFRVVRSVIPTIDEIGLPQVCKDLILKPNGLILLTGPTGCGKSTTLAAMIHHLNHTREYRVITIEDPIEYNYTSGKCVISQREVGLDTHSFATALKHALRQDPDVILVGEMRDPETASMVLMAAETGHLVLSTGHASSASLTIERVVDLFPSHQQPLAQARLASVLQGVLCQMLLPTVDEGRIPAVEVMLATPAVRNLIREGKTHQLQNVIRNSQQMGMCTMDEALIRLFRDAQVKKEEVLSRCADLEEVSRAINEPTSSTPNRRLERLVSIRGEGRGF